MHSNFQNTKFLEKRRKANINFFFELRIPGRETPSKRLELRTTEGADTLLFISVLKEVKTL